MRSIMKNFIIPISSKSDFEEIIDLLHKHNYKFPFEPQRYEPEMACIQFYPSVHRIYYSRYDFHECRESNLMLIFKDECEQLLKHE